MNPAIRNILRSILITTIISLGFGLASFILTKSLSMLLSIFVSTFILQFIIFYFWQSWILSKAVRSEDELYKTYLLQNSKQSVQLNCSYCRSPNTIAININEENVFMCKNCNQQNIVMMEFSTAQVTLPQEQTTVLNTINDIIESDNKQTIKVKDVAAPIEFKS